MITFSNFTLEGKTRVKTVTKDKYPNTAVITKLAIEEVLKHKKYLVLKYLRK